MPIEIVLIRHGVTDWNLQGRLQGNSDVPLAPPGLEQAEAVARRVGAAGGGRFSALYTSDLARARQTADAMAPALGLAPEPDPRLRELDYGGLEGMEWLAARRLHPGFSASWDTDPVCTRVPGGESFRDLRERVVSWLGEVLRNVDPGRERAVVAVTHSGPIKVLVCEALGLPLSLRARFHVDNASVSVLRWNERGPALALLNDYCHLRA